MGPVVAILDCYTVEPSGLGVPPFLSTYARAAYGALSTAHPGADVRYLTIDDVRWCLNEGRPYTSPPLSDPLTYSVTASRDQAIQILTDAKVTVVIAGDAVPSVHLQARNGSVEESPGHWRADRLPRVYVGGIHAAWAGPGRNVGPRPDGDRLRCSRFCAAGAGCQPGRPADSLLAERHRNRSSYVR